MIGYRVTRKIEHAHPLHPKYPLLPGDLLVKEGHQTYAKQAPGMAVIGFVLTPEDEASLELVKYTSSGLLYAITGSAAEA